MNHKMIAGVAGGAFLLVVAGVCIKLAFADPPAKPGIHVVPQYAKFDVTNMDEHNGSNVDSDPSKGHDGIRCRPMAAVDHLGTLTIEDQWVHDFTNHKGIFVTSTSTEKKADDGAMYTYQHVIIRRCEVGPVTVKVHGLHIDCIKADGSVEPNVKPDLLVEDVLIHDTNGGVMTLLCKDGSWGHITLRRVEARNVAHPVIIYGTQKTPIGDVLIDQCPGLRVAIQGDPGCVGTVTVRDSPGAEVANERNGDGNAPWSQINIENSNGTTAPASQPITIAQPATAPAAPVNPNAVEP